MSLVLGLGLEHSCPWPREVLSSERQSLALASDFFCVLGLGLEPCVLDSTSGDESWVYGYDVETKVQSSQWTSKTSPRPKKACQVRSKIKVLLEVFFDASGVVHHDYLPEGSTVNQTYYIEVLKRLRDAIRRKRPELWRSGDWFFHHDNAPAHSALRTREFLAKHSITVLPHPPYSPDLAPCDFFLFPCSKDL